MVLQPLAWLQWYKKPAYVDIKSFANSINKTEHAENDSLPSPRVSMLSLRNDVSIPKNLSLDRIMTGKTCSPMSLYDFYMYLKHIEFSAENLEFITWFKDYEKRWNQQTTKRQRSDEKSISSNEFDRFLKKNALVTEQACSVDSKYSEELTAYIESLVLHEAAKYPKPCCTYVPENLQKNDGPPSVFQQNKEELRHIVEIFITPGGSKELNTPPTLRRQALAGLENSDSSEHLMKIYNHVYALVKDCSHRNFVRLGVNNGTFETLCMVTIVGITFSVLGFLVMFILAFASPKTHQSSRWRGLASLPFWFIGISFLLAGRRGSCFLLLLFSRRQELPWERLEDEKSIRSTKENYFSLLAFAKKLMIFERKIRVKDVGLRRLQRKIVIQSIIGAIVGTAILEVFFLCLPIWK